MKKLIFPVILLALLSGCGKVNGTPDKDNINVVTGTDNGTTTDIATYETEATTDKLTTTGVTSTKPAGEKISGTTAVHTTKNVNVPPATKPAGNDGTVHGTTRSVPTVHRTTTVATPTTAAETTTQTATFDPKDHSNISFSLDSKSNEVKVNRKDKNGEEKTVQTLSDINIEDIEKELKENSKKTFEDFIVEADFDEDGYDDLFIIEKQDALNKTGRYYRYDSEKGIYSAWQELNSLKNLIELDELKKGKIVLYDKKEDNVEYELKTYEWKNASKLILKSCIHQYPTDNSDGPYIDYTDYNEDGEVIKNYTTNFKGTVIEPATNPTEPTTEPITEPTTEPATIDTEEKSNMLR